MCCVRFFSPCVFCLCCTLGTGVCHKIIEQQNNRTTTCLLCSLVVLFFDLSLVFFSPVPSYFFSRIPCDFFSLVSETLDTPSYSTVSQCLWSCNTPVLTEIIFSLLYSASFFPGFSSSVFSLASPYPHVVTEPSWLL